MTSPWPDDADVYDVHYSPDHYGNPSRDVEVTVGDLDPAFVAYVRRLEAVAEAARAMANYKGVRFTRLPQGPAENPHYTKVRVSLSKALADLDALRGEE